MRKSLIFIPDTCVLLDIVRAPVRREFSQDNALAVLEFLRLVRCGTGAVQLIVPPVVRHPHLVSSAHTDRILVADRGEV